MVNVSVPKTNDLTSALKIEVGNLVTLRVCMIQCLSVASPKLNAESRILEFIPLYTLRVFIPILDFIRTVLAKMSKPLVVPQVAEDKRLIQDGHVPVAFETIRAHSIERSVFF